VPCRADEMKRVSCVVGSGEKRETTRRRATGDETWPRGDGNIDNPVTASRPAATDNPGFGNGHCGRIGFVSDLAIIGIYR